MMADTKLSVGLLNLSRPVGLSYVVDAKDEDSYHARFCGWQKLAKRSSSGV